MILQIQRGLREDGFTVPMTKLCRWFDVPRRTVYYKPVKANPKVQDRFAVPIKQMIEAEPSFGYRTVASLLRFNKNTVQRVFQLMGWQVRKRAIGHRPRIEALPSAATTPYHGGQLGKRSVVRQHGDDNRVGPDSTIARRGHNRRQRSAPCRKARAPCL